MQRPSPAPSTAIRPSACPGLLRIVASRDGGICRIKLPGGRLDAVAARAIAAAAERHADGVLEATNRANLQIRGVHAGAEAALSAELLDAGLGPRVAAADDVRNLLLSPAAGIDPAMQRDVTPLADTLLALLQDNPRFHTLSAKFAIQLDGGEGLAMLEHPHDLWLSAMDGGHFAFGLAGCPPIHADDQPALAAVATEQVPVLVEALLNLFLDLAGEGQARMRQLLETTPAERLLEQLDVPLQRDASVGNWRRQPVQPFAQLGVCQQRQPGSCSIGAGFVLGRLDSRLLRALADLSECEGDGTLRLTPWQGVLLPNIPNERADAVLAALDDLGLTTSAEQPLSRLIACSGSTGCARGLADTKGDALRLAERLQEPLPAGVHLCGCPRSCAAAHVAPFTLLAVADGRYDLFRPPQRVAGFGQPLARNLSLDAAADRLRDPGVIPDA
ncbi:precorrin-3B synthase [Pseudomonas knackmussii B13]|uniref:Precorrin-3B synthase n=1 Tax=Pseudomonas knackmussii (strain DSM 6978 / CCUG 54928 / LMG 23759 / B13) TaxID=1301098 RepID=A0A024HC06_PSEKB|nr:precorrin-3B synthase [Pseudomonas knackmussii]CDF82023.1 precorrin-3B synthase [Pseudomonas knackmussii B13]